jgi:hypothetical protein
MTDTQIFKLYGPSGDVIMTGSMNAIMERLPDTSARNDALSTMLDTAVRQVEAEERADAARACAVKHFCDGVSRLSTRMDQFEKARSLAAKRAEAERKARDTARVKRYLDELPDIDDPDLDDPLGILPPAQDPTGTTLAEPDDGDLEVKHKVEPERYGPTEDDEGPGDLPRELEKDVPPPSGSYTSPKLDPLGTKDPHQVQQPISTSLW